MTIYLASRDAKLKQQFSNEHINNGDKSSRKTPRKTGLEMAIQQVAMKFNPDNPMQSLTKKNKQDAVCVYLSHTDLKKNLIAEDDPDLNLSQIQRAQLKCQEK